MAATALIGAACSGGPAATGKADPTPASGPRYDSAPANAPFVATVEGSFDQPFALAFLPDGAMLVTEKAGRLKWRSPAGSVVDVGGVPKVASGGQGGLLDVAVAPDFVTSGSVYLSYAEPRPGGSSLALARAKLVVTQVQCIRAPCPAQARLDGLRVVFRAGSDGKGGQFGAIVAFAPDGQSLFLSSGERQRFTPARDPDQALGKILHLTLDGKAAADNPMAGKPGAAVVLVTDPPRNTVAAKSAPTRQQTVVGSNLVPAATWSSGHRNPYGLAFDGKGQLWSTEMGPRGGDELNLIIKGRDYGWPVVSNGTNYDGVDIPDHRPGDGFEAPRLWWDPSISPGGFMIYGGAAFPAWRGSGFIAALSGEALIRVTLGDRPTKAERWAMGTRLRDVAEAPDGSVWLLEDGGKGAGGRLIRLAPKKG